MTTFGEYIKDLRKKSEISLRKAAEGIEISPAYMSDIEAGKRNPPNMDKLHRLAIVLNMNKDQESIMFDLAGANRNEVPSDLQKYIKENRSIQETLRLAKDKGMENFEWEKVKEFVKEIKTQNQEMLS